MGEKKRERITFQVESELRKRLEKYAELDSRSLSNLIQKVLEDWLKEKEKVEIKSTGDVPESIKTKKGA